MVCAVCNLLLPVRSVLLFSFFSSSFRLAAAAAIVTLDGASALGFSACADAIASVNFVTREGKRFQELFWGKALLFRIYGLGFKLNPLARDSFFRRSLLV